jgi:hypothetical protein
VKIKQLAAVTVIAVLAVSAIMYHRAIHAQQLRSFVLTTTNVNSEPGMVGTRSSTLDYAVRQDGSYVMDDHDVNSRVIIDFEKNQLIHLQLGIKLKSTEQLVTKNVRRVLPALNCAPPANPSEITAKEVNDGEILGVPVQRSDIFITYPAGQMFPEPHQQTKRVWLAPSLGCTLMRSEETWEKWENSKWNPDSTRATQAVSLTFTPVDEFFAVPDGFTEAALGDAVLARWRDNPGKFPEPAPDVIQRFNDEYKKRRMP